VDKLNVNVTIHLCRDVTRMLFRGGGQVKNNNNNNNNSKSFWSDAANAGSIPRPREDFPSDKSLCPENIPPPGMADITGAQIKNSGKNNHTRVNKSIVPFPTVPPLATFQHCGI